MEEYSNSHLEANGHGDSIAKKIRELLRSHPHMIELFEAFVNNESDASSDDDESEVSASSVISAHFLEGKFKEKLKVRSFQSDGPKLMHRQENVAEPVYEQFEKLVTEYQRVTEREAGEDHTLEIADLHTGVLDLLSDHSGLISEFEKLYLPAEWHGS